jgi:hypothetical protein
MDISITKRSDPFEVRMISNGFVVEFSGTDERGEWQNKQFYCPSLTEVQRLMQTFFELKVG